MNFIIKLLKSRDLTIEVKYNSILTITERMMKYKYFILCNKTMTALKLTHLIMRNIVTNYKLLKK
jgi:hypothetical protein